jgi:TetR/AcrR family acrAB operon transcriptional repressor
MRRTKEDARHTREALLDAAEQLFAQRGVSRTSLHEIAKAAGVTRGAVYWHFADKAELFNAMMARTTLPMEDTIEAIDRADQTAPLADLRRVVLDALTRIAEDPRTHRVFDIATHKVEYTDEHMGIRARHREVHLACRDHVEACFRRAQLLGHLPEATDARTMAVAYLAMADGLIHTWMLDASLFDLVSMGARSIDLFLLGLRSTPTLPAEQA